MEFNCPSLHPKQEEEDKGRKDRQRTEERHPEKTEAKRNDASTYRTTASLNYADIHARAQVLVAQVSGYEQEVAEVDAGSAHPGRRRRRRRRDDEQSSSSSSHTHSQEDASSCVCGKEASGRLC